MLTVNAAPVFVGQGTPETRAPASDGDALRVTMANVWTSNRAHGRVLEWLRREDPDVIGLLEVDRRWVRSLAALRGTHPHGIEHPLSNNFGIALYSRIPLDHVELRPLGHPDLKAIVATLRWQDAPLAITLAHPVPPVGSGSARLRNEQLARLAELPREFPGSEFVLLGDLNTTPWSPFYARLERSSGLRNASRGHGYQPTWNSDSWPFALPIDHALLSKGLEPRAFRVGPDVGSDHRPLSLEIVRDRSP